MKSEWHEWLEEVQVMAARLAEDEENPPGLREQMMAWAMKSELLQRYLNDRGL